LEQFPVQTVAEDSTVDPRMPCASEEFTEFCTLAMASSFDLVRWKASKLYRVELGFISSMELPLKICCGLAKCGIRRSKHPANKTPEVPNNTNGAHLGQRMGSQNARQPKPHRRNARQGNVKPGRETIQNHSL
jgi:hypothetical protein